MTSVGGLRVAAVSCVLLVTVGCGGAEPPRDTPVPPRTGPTASAPPPAAAAAPAQPERTVTIRVGDGRADGVPRRVVLERGTTVRIEVTSARADELHVHGYDVTTMVPAGETASVAFVADVPGVFEAELHGLGRPVIELKVN